MKGREKRKRREKERLHRPSQTEHSCHIYPYSHVWHNVTVPNSVVVKVPSSVVISSICVNKYQDATAEDEGEGEEEEEGQEEEEGGEAV